MRRKPSLLIPVLCIAVVLGYVIFAMFAMAADETLPLRYTEGYGGDTGIDSVQSFVFQDADSTAYAKLTRDENTDQGMWYGTVNVTPPGVFYVQHVVWYSDGDTMRVMGGPIQILGATASEFTSSGGGAYRVSINVRDTANDVPIPQALVNVQNFATGVPVGGVQVTNVSGNTFFWGDASTLYTVVARKYGYAMRQKTVAIVDANVLDTLKTYPYPINTPGSAGLKVVYVDCTTIEADTMKARQIEVCFTLKPSRDIGDSVLYETTDSLILGIMPDPYCARANGVEPDGTNTGPAGRAFAWLWPNDAISEYSEYLVEAKRNGKIIWSMRVYLEGTATQELGTIHRSQQD